MDIVTSCYAKLLHLAMLAIRTCESAAAKECVWHARVSSAQRPALHCGDALVGFLALGLV